MYRLLLGWATILVLLSAATVLAGCEGSTGGTGPDGTGTAASSTTAGDVRPPGDADLAGLGDLYFPYAGNGGYDALHYAITLTCDPEAGGLFGTTVVEAEARQSLRTFHLDLAGLEVSRVEVDGVEAVYDRVDNELVVDCPTPLETGQVFSVAVTYSGVPVPLRSAQGFSQGWHWVEDTIYTIDEPEGAATWFPVNDHPSDKATYEFHITVPKPYVAAATGTLAETVDGDTARTFVWEMQQPMANYLAGVSVGDFVSEESFSPAGVPIRNYFDSALADKGRRAFARTGEVLDYFSATFGPYPFDVYGVVVPDAAIGAAMENQTLSLFGRDVLEGAMTDKYLREMFLSHELAHQWFGNSVTLGEWQDIWVNEGFATYASWLWAEHDLGVRGLDMWVEYALESLEAEEEAPPGDPGVGELFGTGVYLRGGLTLHALRLTVGDDIFFDLLREWASRHAYGNATTEDFMALVEEKAGHLSGVDLEGFFQQWLFEKPTPDLPEAVTAG